MNVLKKIFPYNKNIKDFNNLKYDKEGLYSISLPHDAKLISLFIINNLINNNYNFEYIKNNYSILDGTAGVGGNILSFCKYFKKVICYELNVTRYNMLKNNIEIYNFNNIEIYNKNSIESLNNCNIYFFDPPWGGPEYKKTNNIRLKISNYNLVDIIEKIKKINYKSYICFKLPYNYDLNEFKNYNLKKMQVRNMIIILIFSVIK